MLEYKGRRPRFNQAHGAARGTRLCAVADGANFRSLLNGKQGTVTGTTSGIDSALGPVSVITNTAGSNTYVSFASPGLAIPSSAIVACIFTYGSNGNFSGLFGSNQTTFGVMFGVQAAGGSIQCYNGTVLNSAACVPVAGHKYCAAVSYNSSVANFALIDMTTGRFFGDTVTGAAATAAADGTFCLGVNNNFSTNSLVGGMSALHYGGGNYLTLAQLRQWLQAEFQDQFGSGPGSLWYERRQINRAALFSQPSAGGGIAVTWDTGCGFEIIGSLRSDAFVLLEYLASIRSDSVAQIEAIAAVRRDDVILPELVSGLSAGVASQLEFLGSMRSDNLAPLEVAAAFRSDVIALLETTSGQRSDMAAATEIMAALRADLVGTIETTSSFKADTSLAIEETPAVRSDTAAVLEDLAAVQGNVPVEAENQGSISVTGAASVQLETSAKLIADSAVSTEDLASARADAAPALEQVAGVMRNAGVPAESLAGVQGNSPADVENLGGVAVSANSSLQIETTGKITFDHAPNAELTGATRADAGIGAEATVSVSRQAGSGIEFVAKNQSDTGAEMENLGGISVIASAGAPIEISAAMRAEAVTGIEETASVRGSVGLPAEAPVGVMSQAIACAEGLAKVQNNSSAQSEVQGGVTVIAGSAIQIETTSAFAAFTGAVFEFLSKFSLLRPDPRFVSLFGKRRSASLLGQRLTASLLPRRNTSSILGLPVPQGPDFSVMDVGETVNGSVDFSKWLPPGTTIASVVSVTVANYYSAGGSAYIALNGPAAIGTVPVSLGGSGIVNAAVLQQWTGLLPGTARVTATIMTSDGQELIGWVHQPVGQPN